MEYQAAKVTPISKLSDDDDPWNESGESIQDFEAQVIDSTYAKSPLKPLTHFLNLGTLVGVFPAESGERKIRFVLTFSIKLVWAIVFSVVWLGLGVGVGAYCCM